MHCAPLPHQLDHPAEPLSLGYLVSYIRWLFGVYAEEVAVSPQLLPRWLRLCRLRQRFDRLIAQFRAGTLRPERPYAPRPAASGPGRAPSPSPPPSPPARLPSAPVPLARLRWPLALPRRFGWLRQALRWRATYLSNYLDARLAEPEMQALIAAAPRRASRLLRPFCHLLGVVPPPSLALPRRPRRPTPDPPADPPADPSADPEAGRRCAASRPVSPSGRYVRIDGRRIPREWLPGSPPRPPRKPD